MPKFKNNFKVLKSHKYSILNEYPRSIICLSKSFVHSNFLVTYTLFPSGNATNQPPLKYQRLVMDLALIRIKQSTRKLTNKEKFNLIRNHFQPGINYNFPIKNMQERTDCFS